MDIFNLVVTELKKDFEKKKKAIFPPLIGNRSIT